MVATNNEAYEKIGSLKYELRLAEEENEKLKSEVKKLKDMEDAFCSQCKEQDCECSSDGFCNMIPKYLKEVDNEY